MDHQYELWEYKKTLKKGSVKIGSYSSLKQLQGAWKKRQQRPHNGLEARLIVNGSPFVINHEMPQDTLVLNEFRSAEERDKKIIDNAIYFTVVRFLGTGRYERHERETKGEADDLGKKLSKENKANYMIYAVDRKGSSAFVKSICW